MIKDVLHENPCAVCAGRGKNEHGAKCPPCGGSGRVRVEPNPSRHSDGGTLDLAGLEQPPDRDNTSRHRRHARRG